MTTVFLLVLYLGQVQQESNMIFADINRCRYFARTLMRQPAVPGAPVAAAGAGARPRGRVRGEPRVLHMPRDRVARAL